MSCSNPLYRLLNLLLGVFLCKHTCNVPVQWISLQKFIKLLVSIETMAALGSKAGNAKKLRFTLRMTYSLRFPRWIDLKAESNNQAKAQSQSQTKSKSDQIRSKQIKSDQISRSNSNAQRPASASGGGGLPGGAEGALGPGVWRGAYAPIARGPTAAGPIFQPGDSEIEDVFFVVVGPWEKRKGG